MSPRPIRESLIQSSVLAHWRAFGYPGTLVAAIPNMRSAGQPGLTRGLFDLLVIGGEYLRDRTGFIELKTDTGAIRPGQEAFRDMLIANGIPYAITRGRDEPIAVLEQWKIVRPRA